MKVLHVVHRSVPGISGYTIRSKSIVESQRGLSLDPIVVTSPFQSGLRRKSGKLEYLNDIPYYRTNLYAKIGSEQVRSSCIWLSFLRFPLVFLFAHQVLHVAKTTKSAIIHAHSPFYCGLVASWVATHLRIGYVYEVRGVWEDSLLSTESRWSHFPGKVVRFLEDVAMYKADAIVAISEHLQGELLARRASKKVYVVPNGVDPGQFTCTEKSTRLSRELHLDGKIVLGYVGTLSAEYEGLEYLIRALPLITKRCPNVVLLLVGDGRLMKKLRRLCVSTGVDKSVVFPGRVPHDLISEYYSVVDISIFPRISRRVTDLVTPLKPLEAMALGKCVIASNVGGLKELVSDGKTGMLFEAENFNDLADKCVMLVEDQQKRNVLGKQAKEWVLKHRRWSNVVSRYEAIYQTVLAEKGLWTDAQVNGRSAPCDLVVSP